MQGMISLQFRFFDLLFGAFQRTFLSGFDQFVGRIFGQVFGQIFFQGFDQGFKQGTNHKYSVQCYPASRKTLYKRQTKPAKYF